MNILRLCVCSALLMACFSAAQSKQDSTGAKKGMSRLAASARNGFSRERLARIDSVLQEYVDHNRIAGAVALVLRNGQPVYERAVGWSDKEAGRRMTMDTIFRIASQTKAITSTAVLSLVEEGKINLNDPVSKYISSFTKTTVAVERGGRVEMVPAKRSILIRDLLTHTAGISYGTEPKVAALYEAKGLGPAAGYGWYTADKNEPICTSMERLGTLPFVAQPGEEWVYGYNLDILGCVVERVSGMPLDEFVKGRITSPLGLKDTFFYLRPEQRTRLATVYGTGTDGRIVRAPEGSKGQGHYVDGPRMSFAGGAGLLSTARDYTRFLEMIRGGGAINGVRILAPRTVRLMTTTQAGTLGPVFPGSPTPTGSGMGFGFGVTNVYGANGMDGEGAFWWGGAYSTLYRVDPQSGIVMVLMMQMLPDGTDLGQKFPTLVYQALVDVIPPRTPSSTAAPDGAGEPR